MNKDNNNRIDTEKNPTERRTPNQPEVNPDTRTWEASGNPDSDNDRKGRNVDVDLENQGNEISGREQHTSPKNKAKDVADSFSRREQQNRENNK